MFYREVIFEIFGIYQCNKNIDFFYFSPASFMEIPALPTELVIDLQEKIVNHELFLLVGNTSCVTGRYLGMSWFLGSDSLTCNDCVPVYAPGHIEQRIDVRSVDGNNCLLSVEDVLRSSDKSKVVKIL